MIDLFDVSDAPTYEPKSVVLGSYVGWRRDIDIDSTLFDIKYVITPVNNTEVSVEIAGVYANDYWNFEALGSANAAWTGGEQLWEMIVTRKSDAETVTYLNGHMTFYTDTSEKRTHAEVMVVKINSLLENRADSDVASYAIGSRSITKLTLSELRQWRDYYLAEIDRTGGSTNDGVVRSATNSVTIGFT